MEQAASPTWRNQIVWGAVIVIAGVTLLLAIAGLSNLVPPTTPKLVLSGLSCIGFAAWFHVSMERLWGLGFHNSWPILIILWGVKVVLKPVLVKHPGDKE